MGSVFFLVPTADSKKVIPYLWQTPFPKAIQAELVSDNNPSGTITNSDLELCGNIAHNEVIAHLADT